MTQKRKSARWRWLGWSAALIAVAVVLNLIPYPFEAAGEFRVNPVRRAEVRSSIEGLIASVAVREGDRVEADSVIATLSDRTLRRDLDVAQASLRRNLEFLSQLEAGTRPEEVAVSEQSLQLAETALMHSERQLTRARDLHEKQLLSDQELERVERQRDIDFETVELAHRNLILTRAGASESMIEASRAEVERLRIEVRYLEEELERVVLRTPIAGRVTTLYVQDQVGQWVLPGDVVANVEDTQTVWARIGVPEELMDGVRTGATVRAKSWAHPGQVFSGRVIAILPVAVTQSEDLSQQAEVEQQGGFNLTGASSQQRVVPVLAEIDADGQDMFSGLTGYAKIDAGTRSLAYALFHPVFRFVRVRVWSWLP
jgi:putative peptide zinc metalloprotease protein